MLSSTPTPERASEIASHFAEEYFEDDSYHYRLSETLPENTPVDIADQLNAKRRDAPEGAVFLLVYPVGG